MSESVTQPARRGARTFRAACSVLACAALAQAVATAFSLHLPVRELGSAKPPLAPGRTPDSVPADPFASPTAPVPDPHPELQPPPGEPPLDDPAATLLAAIEQPVLPLSPNDANDGKQPALLDVPITNEAVLSSLDEGIYLRSKGDMQGALVHLRRALNGMPGHPMLIYQAATTLEGMGLHAKAAAHWQELRSLGDGAGDYYLLALDRLREGVMTADGPDEEKEGRFKIVDLKEEKLPSSVDGERVRFTAVLEKVMPGPAETLDLVIHFFDSVNGRRLARSQVVQPQVRCISDPHDWREGTESYQFEYYQPALTAEEFVKSGRTRYFGCTLDVIYEDKLQDSAATTQALIPFARELPLPAPEPGDSLLGPPPDAPEGSILIPGRAGGAESALFPPQLKQ